MEFVININEPLISALLALSATINIGLTFKFVYNKITHSHQTANNLNESNPVQFGAGSKNNTVVQYLQTNDPESYKEVSAEIEEKSTALQAGELDLGKYFEDFESKANSTSIDVTTGYTDIDLILDTVKSSQLITIAALPTDGRTTMAYDIARHNAIKLGLPVFMFSMGTRVQSVVDRLISAEAGVDPRKLSSGKLNTDMEFDKVQEAMNHLGEAPIFIDDTFHSNTSEVGEIIKKATQGKKVGLVIIDGVELLNDYQDNITSTLTNLRRISNDLDLPVIITVPFPSSPIANRGGRARLSDLPEAFSQISDIVLAINPINHWEDEERPGIKTISILKNRSGSTGMEELYYDNRYLRFLNLDKSYITSENEDDF